MATTSLNPGVGPTNADIATAVAAPSAATIAAAVAAPSAATIAAAVAAPSSATIASAVAAAVPTTAGITTIVQANAGSPYSGTITNLGYQSGNGASTVTFSSLGGYKKVVIRWTGCDTTSATNARIRINGDTGVNYGLFGRNLSGTAWSANVSAKANNIYMQSTGSGANASDFSGLLTLIDSNSGAYKIGKVEHHGWDGGTTVNGDKNWIWASTAAITSVSIYIDAGTFTTSGIAGFYAIGYN